MHMTGSFLQEDLCQIGKYVAHKPLLATHLPRPFRHTAIARPDHCSMVHFFSFEIRVLMSFLDSGSLVPFLLPSQVGLAFIYCWS